MITIKEVRAYLEHYAELENWIDNAKARKEKKWAQATNGTSHLTPDKVQTSSGCSTEDLFIELAEFDEEIKAYKTEQKEIINTIRKVKPLMHSNLLEKYYTIIPKPTLTEVAEMCGYDESWGTSTHGRALQGMQYVLNEREKENACLQEK